MARRWFCNFRERFTGIDRPDSGLSFRPERWSSAKIGGPDTAEIAVSGPLDTIHEALRLLGDRVRILNDEGSIRWVGYVHEAEINYGATVVRVSLEAMANRIAVVYTAPMADGTSERRTTDWAEDSGSIARFGIKELRPSFEGTDEAAMAFRDAELARLAWPVPQVRATGGAVLPSGTGILFCRGSWHRLSWQYWQNLAGLEEYTDDGAGETTIGASYTATTISFTAADDILDSNSGLGSLAEGDSITVSGATNAANNGDFTVETEGAAAIEVAEAVIVNEGAGSTITISRNGPRVDRIAQSFTLSHNTDPWYVAKIAIRAQRGGAAAEDLVLHLCADAGGQPGTVLETVEVAGATIAEDMQWVEFVMAATTQLSYGVTYWIQVRTYTPSLASYFIVDVNEDAGYGLGTCLTYNGSSWSTRTPAADMPFRVIGSEDTLDQVRSMIEANADFGPNSVVVIDASGIKTEQYREGDTLVSDEVEDLIAMGRSSGESLIVELTENRHSLISQQPATSTALSYRSRRDGQIEVATGALLPPGATIAGVWVQPDDLPILDIFKAATAVFVAESAYDARADNLIWDSDGALSVYKGRRMQRG